jgi:hypothetical protein
MSINNNAVNADAASPFITHSANYLCRNNRFGVKVNVSGMREKLRFAFAYVTFCLRLQGACPEGEISDNSSSDPVSSGPNESGSAAYIDNAPQELPSRISGIATLEWNANS